jgi:putative MATE family efflux protein
MATLEQDLTQGSVSKKLLKFGIPLFLANALTTLYSLVDTVIVGQFIGSDGISAVTIGSQFMFILCCIGMGFANGGQVVIANLKGAGNREGQRETIGTLLSLSVIAGIIVSVFGIVVVNPALGILNTPDEAWDQAKDYMIITSAGMVLQFIFNAISGVMRGLGDSTRPLVFVAIASVVNIILDIVFVGPLGMGAGGAGLATTIAIGISAAFGVIYLYRRRASFVFDFKLDSFKIRRKWMGELIRMGIPQMIQMLAINISVTFVLALANAYGVAASATIGVGNKVLNIFTMPANAMGTAATAMTGQNVGAGKLDRVKKILDWTLLINLCFGALSAVAFGLFPEVFVKIFDSSPDVVKYCSDFLQIHILFCFGISFIVSYNAPCLGVGNSMLSTVGFLADGVVARLALCLIFTRVFDFGLYGLFWANALGPIFGAVIFAVYYYSGAWRRYGQRQMAKSNGI